MQYKVTLKTVQVTIKKL